MAYNLHIDKTEEALRELRDAYRQDEIDRFVDGLESGMISTEEQVIEFTNKIRTNDGLTRLEYSRLQALRPGFIEKYATNYNKRFSTVHLLMNRMRSGISRGMKTLEAFCEKKKRKGHSKKRRGVIKSSKMGKAEYTPSMWGLEHYKDSVKMLYKEVVNYQADLTKCIDLCLEMVNDVNYVRTHPERAEEIYDKCHRETVFNRRIVIKRFLSINANMQNDILDKMEEWERQKKAMKNLKAKLYHTLDEAEWDDLCICEEVMLARQEDVTNEERALWGDNKQQIMRVRVVFDHLDELEPEGQKGHIGGRFLARLFHWCNVLPNRGLDKWYTYFYSKYTSHGQLTPCKPSAIKMERTKIAKLDNQEDQKEQAAFNSKIDELLNRYMIEPQKDGEVNKAAVNF